MDDEKLISEVRDHECLYNTKSADYKVLLKKENAWKAVAAALGEQVSVEDCMKQWKAIRERFAREAKKKIRKSGDEADNTPNWPYFDQLLFLKDFIKHRKTTGNVDTPIVVEEEQVAISNEDQEEEPQDSSTDISLDSSRASTPHAHASTAMKYKKKRKRSAIDEVDEEILRQLGNMKDSDADQDSLFAQSIAASLRQMDPQKKSLAKIKIHQALYEVDFSPSFPPQQHNVLPPPSNYPPFTAGFVSDD